MSTLRLLSVEIRFEQDVVVVRQRARELAASLGFERQTQTGIATALSEIARNAFQYAGGGRVDFAVETEPAPSGRRTVQCLVAAVKDSGKGIPNLEEVLSGKYRSESGLGLGLIGSHRLMDRVEVATSPQGTTVTLTKTLPPGAGVRTPKELQAVVDELVARPPASPMEEVQQQNRELLRALEETQERQEELARVNAELAETNTGVLALYDELETLHRIGTTLATKLELQALIQTIVDVTTSLTDAELGLFFFHGVEPRGWELFASTGASPEVLEKLKGTFAPEFFGAEFPGEGPLRLRPAGGEEAVPFVSQLRGAFAVGSLLAVPVADATGAALGALVFASGLPEGFSERCERILSSVATQAAVGIEKARLFESVTAASNAKDQFLAMLSHELRTPLNPVLAIISELQGDGRLPVEVAEDLAVVWRNVRLEARLIDDLLDFNRLINGKVEIERSPLDVHGLIGSVVEICRQEFEQKGQEIVVDLRAERPVVAGDSPRLQQVLWNILRNAIKFTPKEGRIVVATANVDGRLDVSVTDNGRGIDPIALENIFRAFEQGSAQIAGRFGGLGLGLAIARMFAELHHGTITATSEGEGRGACFIVSLPVAVQPVLPKPVEAPANAEPSQSSKARILVVDDHRDTLQTLQRLLSRRGYEVTTAGSALEARGAVAVQTFDLLISDLGLPDGNGQELLRSIRATHAFPAIALSGYGMESDVAQSTQAGFQAHLTKPVDFAELTGLIEKLLK